MGKNPNADRQKRSKHVEKTFENDLDQLQEEAARLGCEVWELEKMRKQKESDEDSSEEEAKVETAKGKTKKLRVVEESKHEEVDAPEEERDSDD